MERHCWAFTGMTRVTMLNINHGRNRELLEACEPLNEYSLFVDHVRQLQGQGYGLDVAVENAVRQLPAGSRIRKLLEEHMSEVKGMILTEYDEKATMDFLRNEALKEGRKERDSEIARNMLSKGMPPETICECTGLSREELMKIT